MSADQMFDLTISALADGGIELEQLAGGLEEPDRITLHPCQVRLLAERAGLGERHTRRLYALRSRIEWLFESYYDEIVESASGLEISLHLRAIEDLVDDLINDIGTAAPTEPAPECHEVPATNTVTRKPGPKPSGNALTDAERQRAHRAKQQSLPLADNASTGALESNIAPRSSDLTERVGEHRLARDNALGARQTEARP